MKIWPWSRIAQLRNELRIARKQLDAVHFAALGAFHAFENLDGEYYCEALNDIIRLDAKLADYEERCAKLENELIAERSKK